MVDGTSEVTRSAADAAADCLQCFEKNQEGGGACLSSAEVSLEETPADGPECHRRLSADDYG